MRFVVLGSGQLPTPPIGVAAHGSGSARRGSVASVLQPNHPGPPTLLMDAGPDLWSGWMAWADAPSRLDAVILSHAHLDHTAGLGNFMLCTPAVPLYATSDTLADVRGFAASVTRGSRGLEMLGMEPRVLPERGETDVCGVRIETVPLNHISPLTGIIVRHRGRCFVHLSDTGPLIEASVRGAIRGCDLLVVHTPSLEETEAHVGVDGAVSLACDVEAKRLVLTHFGHAIPRERLAKIEAAHPRVIAAYDGMVLDL